jgi:hypothetical protein
MIVVAGNPPSGPQTMWGVTGGQAFVAGGDWVRYTTPEETGAAICGGLLAVDRDTT